MFLDSIFELLLLVTQGTVTLIPRVVPHVMNRVLGTVKKEVSPWLPCLLFFEKIIFFDTARSRRTKPTRRVGAFNTAVAVEAAPELTPITLTPTL